MVPFTIFILPILSLHLGQKIIAGVAIVNGSKILIIQRSADEDIFPNLWEFPSGKKEPMEKIEEAARREAKEETGLDIEVKKPITVFNFGWEKENEIRDATEIVFLATLKGKPEVKLSSEHQNFAWVDANGIENYEASKEIKEAAREALSDF